MLEEEINRFARRYGDAWANPDTEVFLSLFSPEATYCDRQVGRFSRGHDELRAFHSHFVSAISEIRMEFPRVFGIGKNVCLEWIFSGRQSGTYHGKPATGISFTGKGVALMELNSDGLIESVVDYYDSAPVKQQLMEGEQEN